MSGVGATFLGKQIVERMPVRGDPSVLCAYKPETKKRGNKKKAARMFI
jgi:hypothetical protein